MYEDLQQQLNYLPDMKGQLGVPFLEDVTKKGLLIASDSSKPVFAGGGPKPLEAGASRQAERPEERGGGAKQSEAMTTSEKAAGLSSSPAAEPTPAGFVESVADDDLFDHRNYGCLGDLVCTNFP